MAAGPQEPENMAFNQILMVATEQSALAVAEKYVAVADA
jgi:hypothetical protein